MNYQLLTVNRACGAKNPRPRILFRGDWLNSAGFVPGALVQAAPEPDGMLFTLCNENIKSYSELLQETRGKGGNLITVYHSEAKDHVGATFLTTGKYIYDGGLSIGDLLAAKCDYGMIRVRKIDPDKLGFRNIHVLTVGSTDRGANTSKNSTSHINLTGEFLLTAGFERDFLAVLKIENHTISLILQQNLTDFEQKYTDFQQNYVGLVRFARKNGVKLLQIAGQLVKPTITVSASILEKAGFVSGDILVAGSNQNGIIKLQKLDYQKLGF
jgi:hypothetical protein